MMRWSLEEIEVQENFNANSTRLAGDVVTTPGAARVWSLETSRDTGLRLVGMSMGQKRRRKPGCHSVRGRDAER